MSLITLYKSTHKAILVYQEAREKKVKEIKFYEKKPIN